MELKQLADILKNPWILPALKAFFVLLAGSFVASLVSRLTVRLLNKTFSPQRLMIIRKALFYGISILAFVIALGHLGIDLKVLLGAAGVLTVALGFASQTSVSNLISGLFLITEQPFVVGDVIKVGETTGTVISVDLLSSRLKTYENIMVRIPNEVLMKSQINNFSHFPIRRLDFPVFIAYKEEIEKVRNILLNLVVENPLCLNEPNPLFIVLGFGDSAINLQFSVWTKRENFLAVKNGIQEEIKKAFDKHHIEIPFPHRTLYVGTKTDPFPVKMIKD
jgi:small-conductance mechanosensitive channel